MFFINKTLLILSFFTVTVSAHAGLTSLSSELPDDKSLVDGENSTGLYEHLGDSIVNFGKLFLHTPYRYGANGASSFDCSGFTSFVYKNFGVTLDRSSSDQAKQFPTLGNADLKRGDLVFFEGRKRNGKVGHVGIVSEIKDNGEFDFIHASINKGVTITNSAEDYYKARFVGGGRVLNNDSMAKLMSASSRDLHIYVTEEPAQIEKSVVPAKYHYVKKGETLYQIASKYGTTVAQLKKKNHLTKDALQIKQRLLIADEKVVTLVRANTPKLTDIAETTCDQVAEEIEEKAPQTNKKHKAEKVQELAIVKEGVHKVKSGETLMCIAKKYDTTVEQLKELNGLSGNAIEIGKLLIIHTDDPNVSIAQVAQTPKPAQAEEIKAIEQPLVSESKAQVAVSETKDMLKQETSDVEKETLTHKVKKGETLYSIAQQYGVSIDDLRMVNGISGNALAIGQSIKIDTGNISQAAKTVAATKPTVAKPKNLTHVVKKGENYTAIAQRYGCKVSEIKKWNNRTSDRLNAGEKLIIHKT